MLCFAVNSRPSAPEDVPGEGEQLRTDLCQAFAKLKGAGSTFLGHSALAIYVILADQGNGFHLVFDCHALQRVHDKTCHEILLGPVWGTSRHNAEVHVAGRLAWGCKTSS